MVPLAVGQGVDFGKFGNENIAFEKSKVFSIGRVSNWREISPIFGFRFERFLLGNTYCRSVLGWSTQLTQISVIVIFFSILILNFLFFSVFFVNSHQE